MVPKLANTCQGQRFDAEKPKKMEPRIATVTHSADVFVKRPSSMTCSDAHVVSSHTIAELSRSIAYIVLM